MRNLKRVLSLALASVMLIGMMAIGAGAADYNDSKDISYEEAAAVMSAIGVFQGDNNGNFNPKGDLTREAAAKIITYMLMGKEAADGLATSTAPFTDVAANRWSAGSIAYCVQNGIVAGDGQGHFFPEAVVTGSQFGKMLLGALGYQAEAEGLVGSGWEINVAKLVKLAKLNKNLSVTLSRTMTREQAAQMAFNTLNASLVEYQGGTKVTTPDGTVVNVGGVRYPLNELFRESNFPTLKRSVASNETFGRPGNTWKFGAKNVGTFGSKPEFVYTSKITEDKDLKADLTGYALGVESDGSTIIPASITVNNEVTGAISTNATLISGIKALTANGTAVEVYTSGDVVYAVVAIETKLATINNVNTTKKSISFKLSDGIEPVTAEDDEAMYNELAAMGKDAKVLVNVDGDDGTALAIAEPETIEGAYTAKNASGSEITVGGSKYKVSAKAGSDVTGMTMGNTYILYLDAYGYAIGAEEEKASETQVAYVKNIDREGSASSGYSYMAQLVFTDGTQKWAEVSKVGTTDIDEVDDLAEFKGLVDKGDVVEYSVRSGGEYVLTVLAGADINDTVLNGSVDIEKGKANFIKTSSSPDVYDTTISGSSKTVFLVAEGSSFKAYTGVKNVPNLEDVEGTIAFVEGTSVAKLVVVTEKTTATDSSSLAYVIKSTGSRYDTDLKKTIYSYDAIVKGAVVTLETTNAIAAGDMRKMHTVSYDSNGYGVAVSTTVDATLVKVSVSATVENGVITLTGAPGAGTYVVSDDFKVVAVDSKDKAGVISSSEVEDYDDQVQAFVILDSDKEFAISLIVVQDNT